MISKPKETKATFFATQKAFRKWIEKSSQLEKTIQLSEQQKRIL